MSANLDLQGPPPNPGDRLKRVLVIKLGPLGEFMETLGAMRVVRATHPSARITLLTTEPFDAFAKACPYFDIVESDGAATDGKAKSDMFRRIRSDHYDMVYDFQNNDRTEAIFASLVAKRPLWSGVVEGASHRHRNPDRDRMNIYDRLAEQLEHAGLTPRGQGDPSGWIRERGLLPYYDWIRPAFRDPPRFKPAFFGLNGPYMLLIPGAPHNRSEWRWPAERYAQLASWIADCGVTPVVIGDRAETDAGQVIQKLEPRARSLINRTDFFQLCTLSQHAQFAVGGETGPMHLAVSAGCDAVCLFMQSWSQSMELEHGSVWEPSVRLGRDCPRGSNVIALFSDELDRVALEDLKRAIVGLGKLPRDRVGALAAAEAARAKAAAEAALATPVETLDEAPEETSAPGADLGAESTRDASSESPPQAASDSIPPS